MAETTFKTKVAAIFGMTLVIASMIGLGWSVNELWRMYSNDKYLNGLYFYSGESESSVLSMAREKEMEGGVGGGDWVCVNVAYEMEPKEAYTTCVHECSHKAFSEIYAEDCEANPDKCLEWLNEKE